jgi:hypothetical protein
LALAATTLTACGDKSVTFGHYWRTNSLAKNEAFYEHAEYVVSSTSTQSSYVNYTVEYAGTFTTTLEYIANDGVYKFDTNLEVTATFKLGDEKKEVKDTAKSSVTFDAEGNTLRPVKSHKEMVCHTPLSGEFSKVENCFATIEYSYDIEYATDKNQGTIKSTTYNVTNNAGETKQYLLNDTFDFVEDYTNIDNEQLLVAVRAFNGDTSSATVGVYGAFAKIGQTVSISYANADEDASTPFAYALINSDGSDGGASHKVLTRTASIVLDQENPGNTQEIVLAKTKNAENNTHRNVILSIKNPLSYSMGYIEYKLAKVSYFKA